MYEHNTCPMCKDGTLSCILVYSLWREVCSNPTCGYIATHENRRKKNKKITFIDRRRDE